MQNTNSQQFHIKLSHFNQQRMMPDYVDENWAQKIKQELSHLIDEGEFVESQRAQVQQHLVSVPTKAKVFKDPFPIGNVYVVAAKLAGNVNAKGPFT